MFHRSFLFLAVLFLLTPNYCLAQNLYAYSSDKGSITFTARRPQGKTFWKVAPKVPSKSIFVHRGLGYDPKIKPKPSSFDTLITQAAIKFRLEAAILKAVMHVESAFNPSAKSPVGARGLMQLMPATAKRFGVANMHDPKESINGGSSYLKWLFKEFDGDLKLVLAGYNAGEGAVKKYGGIPPYRETKDYVKRVLQLAKVYRCDFSGSAKSCKQ